MTLNFYSSKGETGYLSNFAPYPLEIDGRSWPTSEHYFQAAKFFTTEPAYAEAIRQATTPTQAARMGRSRAHPLRADWETVKESMMRRALLTKFNQHPDLMTRLLATAPARLVEHTKRDRYWGDGGDGTGQNRLGLMLTELRDAWIEVAALPDLEL